MSREFFTKSIKVNVPQSAADMATGNGTGIWALCTESDYIRYYMNDDSVNELFTAIADNYEPPIYPGDLITLSTRGKNRPTVTPSK